MNKQSIKINRLRTDQAVQLAALQTRTFTEAYADVHSPEDIKTYCAAHYSPEAAAKELASEENVCCMGLLNSEPVGYYIVKHKACPITLGSESSELKQIYTLRSAYGVGLGQVLCEHALTAIRSAGRKLVWLCVSDSNYRAKAFYEKLRFKKIGTGPFLIVGRDELSSSILALKI